MSPTHSVSINPSFSRRHDGSYGGGTAVCKAFLTAHGSVVQTVVPLSSLSARVGLVGVVTVAITTVLKGERREGKGREKFSVEETDTGRTEENNGAE